MNLKAVKEFLEPGMFHFILAVLFGGVGFLWGPLGLPDVEELTVIAQDFFEKYGIITLLVAAFIESVFMISFYFPGSFVVVLAILVSDRSFGELSTIVVISWISILLATVFNYWLGREGFYRLLLRLGSRNTVDKMQVWLLKRGNIAVFLSAFHPNFLAIANICMGIARTGLVKSLTLSFIGIAFWVPIAVYLFGFVLPKPEEQGDILLFLVVAALVLWGVVLVVKEQLKLYKEKSRTNLTI